MNSFYFLVLALTAILASGRAFPVTEDDVLDEQQDFVKNIDLDEIKGLVEDQALKQEIGETPLETPTFGLERGGRFRRATCDIGSISLPFIQVNHSACAIHCIAKRRGYKGGYCKRAVCHCRR